MTEKKMKHERGDGNAADVVVARTVAVIMLFLLLVTMMVVMMTLLVVVMVENGDGADSYSSCSSC